MDCVSSLRRLLHSASFYDLMTGSGIRILYWREEDMWASCLVEDAYCDECEYRRDKQREPLAPGWPGEQRLPLGICRTMENLQFLRISPLIVKSELAARL